MGFMAEMGMGSVNVGGTVSSIMNGLYIVVGLAIIAGIGYYIMFIKQFKHKFRIKEVINGRKVIVDDKAREFKDSDGAVWWQLYKKNQKLAMPPPEAVEIDNRGRKCVEAYKTSDGEFIYALDTAKLLDIPEEFLKMKDGEEKEAKIKAWRAENNVIDAFQPYTTKQRLIMISQHRKALSKKKKKWQDYLMPVTAIASVTIIVISLIVFYADMGEPLLKMADKQIQYETIQKQQLEVIKELKYDIQTIRDEKEDTTDPPN